MECTTTNQTIWILNGLATGALGIGSVTVIIYSKLRVSKSLLIGILLIGATATLYGFQAALAPTSAVHCLGSPQRNATGGLDWSGVACSGSAPNVSLQLGTLLGIALAGGLYVAKTGLEKGPPLIRGSKGVGADE